MDDNYVLNYIQKYNGKFKCNYLPNDIKEYLLNRYEDCDSLNESYFRIKNNLNESPKCIICGNHIKFNGRNYNKTCCKDCAKEYSKQNREKACLIKYGVKNPYQIPNIIEHIKTINKAKRSESNVKLKITNNIKYGGNSPTCSNEIKEKIKNKLLLNYGVTNAYLIESVKENCKNENIKNKNIHKQKRKITCQEKYGIDNVYKIKEIQNKAYQTKKKNKTFITSKFEEYCYNELIKYFKEIKRQYKSELYPFCCDFYIPEIDTYIEIQGHWAHGPHQFDPNNLQDQLLLKKWQSKNNSDYYKRSIKAWTIIDPLKRNTAKQNKLNFYEFYNINEFNNWLNKIKNIIETDA